jgi:nucleotidyltransferase substrate binding protein (TIGR01987 family)
MASYNIDYTPLRKAVASVEQVLLIQKTGVTRDAAIKRFEYTFELCWKFLKRWLENETADSTIDSFSKKELFRAGREYGLIRDVEAWFRYNRARNETAHTYNETKAEEVYAVIKDFVADAQFLLDELERRKNA